MLVRREPYRSVFSLLVALASCGWLFPMWLAGDSFVEGLRKQDSPTLNSFPYLAFSQEAFGWGCVWLATVLLAWMFVMVRILLVKRNADSLVLPPMQHK